MNTTTTLILCIASLTTILCITERLQPTSSSPIALPDCTPFKAHAPTWPYAFLIIIVWLLFFLRKLNNPLLLLTWLMATAPANFHPTTIPVLPPPTKKVRFNTPDDVPSSSQPLDYPQIIHGFWYKKIIPGEDVDTAQQRLVKHFKDGVTKNGPYHLYCRVQLALGVTYPLRTVTTHEHCRSPFYPHFSEAHKIMSHLTGSKFNRELLLANSLTSAQSLNTGFSKTIHTWIDKFALKERLPAILAVQSTATAALSLISVISHKSAITTATLVSSLLGSILAICNFLDVDLPDDLDRTIGQLLEDETEAVIAEAWYDNLDEFRTTIKDVVAGPVTTVTGFFISIAASIIVAITTSKSPIEVIGKLPALYRHNYGGVQSFKQAVNEIIAEIAPDKSIKAAKDILINHISRLETLVTMEVNDFIIRENQDEIAAIRAAVDATNTNQNQKDPAFSELYRQYHAMVQRYISKRDINSVVIGEMSRIRQIPVMVNLTGAYGHGKSFLARDLYRAVNERLVTGGHRSASMLTYNMSNGGDDHVPPPGNAEWYVLDEYLANPDTDKWVRLMNNLVSGDPFSISSAFSKFNNCRAEFVITTSNRLEGQAAADDMGAPFQQRVSPGNFTFSQNSPNFMPPSVLMAYRSRSNWVTVENPLNNPVLPRNNQRFPLTGPTLRRWTHTADVTNTHSNWHFTEMTKDALVDWMTTQWIANRASFLAERDRALQSGMTVAQLPKSIMPPPQVPFLLPQGHLDVNAEAGPCNTENPAVIYISGAPGIGKTRYCENDIIGSFPNHTVVRITKESILSDFLGSTRTIFIFDDIFNLSTLSVKNYTLYKLLEAYRIWFDQIDGSNIIVILDNWVPPTVRSCVDVFGYFSAIRVWASDIWRTRGFYQKLWTAISFYYYRVNKYPDLSVLPREATLRRLGFSGPCYYRGKIVSGSMSRSIAVAMYSHGVQSYSALNFPALSFQEFTDQVYALGTSTRPPLEKVPYIPTDGVEFDLDVKLPSITEFYGAIGSSNPDKFIRFVPSLFTSFPDYTALVQCMNPEDLDSVYSTLDNAYRRADFSCRIIVEHLDIVVLNGKISGLPIAQEVGQLLSITDQALVFSTGNDINFPVTFVQIFTNTVDLTALPRTCRTIIGKSVSNFRETGHYTAWAREYAKTYQTNASKLQTVALWTRAKEVMSQPKIQFLCFSIMGLLGAAGIIFTIVKLSETAAIEPVESETPPTDPVQAESWREKREQALKRTVTTTPTNAVTASPQPHPASKTLEAIHRIAPTASDTAVMKRLHNIHQRNATATNAQVLPDGCKISTLSDTITQTKLAVERNTVLVSVPGIGKVHGLAIKDNYVLTTAHVYDGKSPIFVHSKEGSNTRILKAIPIFLDRQRELLLIQITDKCAPFKNITSKFLRRGNLGSLSELVHYLPGDQTMYRCEATYNAVLPAKLTDTKNPLFNPFKDVLVVNRFETSTPTTSGSCGTTFFSLNPRHEGAVICGLHIASGSHFLSRRSYASAITFEDLQEIFASTVGTELVTAEVYNDEPEYTSQSIVLGSLPPMILPSHIHLDVDAVEDPKCTPFETPRFTAIGYSPSFFKPIKENTAIVPSIISEVIDTDIIPNDQTPSIKTFCHPSLTDEALSKLPLNHRGEPSIVLSQLQHIAGPHTSLPPTIRQIVIDSFFEMIQSQPGIRRWRILSDWEVLNGISDADFAAGLGPMRTDASPGMPWVSKGHGTKASLLQIDSTPTGNIISFSSTPDGLALAQAYSRTFDGWLEGRQTLRLVDASLKAECLPIEKALKPGTRVFAADAMETFLAQRKVLGYVNSIAMLGRFSPYVHHTTGINVYTEFWKIYEHLRTVGTHGFDLDYSKFDKRIPTWAWDVLIDVFVRIAQDSDMRTQHSNSEIQNLVSSCIISFRDKFYVTEGTFFWASGDMASGVFATNVMDSYLNDILVLSSLAVLADSKIISTMHNGRLHFPTIHANFCWFTHGDDIIASVSAEWAPHLTFASYQSAMASVGVVVTTTAKDGSSYDLVPVEELSFIGRTFEFDPSSFRPHGMLRYTALCRMVHWTEDPCVRQLLQSLASFAIELRAYPEDLYTVIREEILMACRARRVPFALPQWQTARHDLICERDAIVDAQMDPNQSGVSSLASTANGHGVAPMSREASVTSTGGPRASVSAGLPRNDTTAHRISKAQPQFSSFNVHGGGGELQDERGSVAPPFPYRTMQAYNKYISQSQTISTSNLDEDISLSYQPISPGHDVTPNELFFPPSRPIDYPSSHSTEPPVPKVPSTLHVTSPSQQAQIDNADALKLKHTNIYHILKTGLKCPRHKKARYAHALCAAKTCYDSDLELEELVSLVSEVADRLQLPFFWVDDFTKPYVGFPRSLKVELLRGEYGWRWHFTPTQYATFYDENSIKFFNENAPLMDRSELLTMLTSPEWKYVVDELGSAITDGDLPAQLDWIWPPYKTEERRLRTLRLHEVWFNNPTGWRLRDFAQAGFFVRRPATLTCAACNINLTSWHSTDAPLHQHLENSPTCKYAQDAAILYPHLLLTPAPPALADDEGYDESLDFDPCEAYDYFTRRFALFASDVVASSKEVENPIGVRCFGSHRHVDVVKDVVRRKETNEYYCTGYRNVGFPGYDGYLICRCASDTEHHHTYTYNGRLYCDYAMRSFAVSYGSANGILVDSQMESERTVDYTTSTQAAAGGDPTPSTEIVALAASVMAPMEHAPVAPTAVSGVIPPMEEDYMAAPVLPPGMGTMTGFNQWTTYQSIMGTPAILKDSSISANSTAVGSTIFAAPYFGLLGKDHQTECKRDTYFEGPMSITIRFTSSSMTIGNVMVVAFPDTPTKTATLAAITSNVTALTRFPHILIPLNMGTVTKTFTIADAMPTGVPRVRRTVQLGTNPVTSEDCPWIAVVMYDKIVNAYGTDLVIPYRIFGQPAPGFRTWGPAPLTAAPSDEAVTLPPVKFLYMTHRYYSLKDKREFVSNSQKSIGFDDYHNTGMADIPHTAHPMDVGWQYMSQHPESQNNPSFYNDEVTNTDEQDRNLLDTPAFISNSVCYSEVAMNPDDTVNFDNCPTVHNSLISLIDPISEITTTIEKVPFSRALTRTAPYMSVYPMDTPLMPSNNTQSFRVDGYTVIGLPIDPISEIWPHGPTPEPPIIEADFWVSSSDGASFIDQRVISGLVGMAINPSQYNLRSRTQVEFSGLNAGPLRRTPIIAMAQQVSDVQAFNTPNYLIIPTNLDMLVPEGTSGYRWIAPTPQELTWVRVLMDKWASSGGMPDAPFKCDLSDSNFNVLITLGISRRNLFVRAVDKSTQRAILDGQSLVARNFRAWDFATPLEDFDTTRFEFYDTIIAQNKALNFARKLVNAKTYSPFSLPISLECNTTLPKTTRKIPKLVVLNEKGSLETRSEAMAGATIAGGILGGLGDAFGQWGQNAWWSKQFDAQWKHDQQMAADQRRHEKEMSEAEIKAQEAQTRAEHAGNIANQRLAQHSASAGHGVGEHIPSKTTASSPSPSPSSQTTRPAGSSLQKGAASHPNNRVPSRLPKRPYPPTATSAFPDLNIESTGRHPRPLPAGANVSNEQFHPSIGLSNLTAGTNPTTLNQAVNPYTESMKRVR